MYSLGNYITGMFLQAPMIIDDDEDFKESAAATQTKKVGVAKAVGGAKKSQPASKSKRKRKQVLNESGKLVEECVCVFLKNDFTDSEDDNVSPKRSKSTPTQPSKKPAPKKSPATAKPTAQRTLTSFKAKKIEVTVSNFFGPSPIRRSQRSSKQARGKSDSGSLEVSVIPESPMPAEGGGCTEFEDVNIEEFMEEEDETEKGKREVQYYITCNRQ